MITLHHARVLAFVFLFTVVGCGSAEPLAFSEFPTTPLIDPNTASESELLAVAELSDDAVAALVAGRPYATPSELHKVVGAGLSAAEIDRIFSVVFVKVGLNTGAEEDYKLIPSTMSPRKLAHEFEEYRPYESMDQFRREMGKYVSEAEVSYLARYVTLD